MSPFLLLLGSVLAAHAAGSNRVERLGEEQRQLVRQALGGPQVMAARAGVLRAMAERAAVRGFYDPALLATGGWSDGPRVLPGAGRSAGLTRDATVAEAAIEAAVWPGAYLSAGVSERYLADPGTGHDSLYQSVAGVQARVPLLRDRGFAFRRLDEDEARQRETVARAQYLAVCQDVAAAVERAFVEWLAAEAEQTVSGAALERSERLVAEARELVRMKAIPEYQVRTVAMEVALNREEVEAASQRLHSRRMRVEELAGEGAASAGHGDDALVCLAHASAAGLAAASDPQSACRRRGSYRAACGRIEEAAVRIRRAREQRKAELLLVGAATWQGEDPDDWLGGDAILDEENVGTEVALVWRRNLANTGPRALERALAHERRALELEREAMVRSIAAELAVAVGAVESARARLKAAESAVEDAVRTLQAESDRFRLGEGRSRNVLDAQKDVTRAERRRNEAAAALLLGVADRRHAEGTEGAEDESP